MLPITGPFSYSFEFPPGTPYRRRLVSADRWRQVPPYNLPLRYRRVDEYVEGNLYDLYPHLVAVNSTGDPELRVLTRVSESSVYNLPTEYAKRTARSRFNDKVSEDRALLGMLYHERKKSLTTISNRSLQLAAFFKYLPISLPKAYSYLVKSSNTDAWRRIRDLSKSQSYAKLKRGARSWSSDYLEYAFGVVPTVSDIMASTRILASGIPPAYVRATGRYKQTLLKGGLPSGAWSSKTQGVHSISSRVTIGAEVIVDNPNLWLANQLGLLNPIVVGIERVPWSFVANYFINLSEYFSQFTEHWGLTIQNPYYSVHIKDDVLQAMRTTNGSGVVNATYLSRASGSNFERFVGALPAIKLGSRKPWIMSVQRGSTSVALLLQRLPR